MHVFLGGCMVFSPGRGGCMVFSWEACMVFSLGGVRGFFGGHACFFQGHVWLPGGPCMVAGGVCIGYDEIRSMSGRYASYWNAFLFIILFLLLMHLVGLIWSQVPVAWQVVAEGPDNRVSERHLNRMRVRTHTEPNILHCTYVTVYTAYSFCLRIRAGYCKEI